MLLRRSILDRIRAGDVSLAFRQWTRPTVREGSTLRTTVGVLLIESVRPVAADDITERDLLLAGYESGDAARDDLAPRPGARLYRISLRWHGEDPRITLRNADEISQDDFEALRKKLRTLDGAAALPWTGRVLETIGRSEAIPAAQLATALGTPKDLLKRNLRKLKELGLTESLTVGYRLSPRGGAYLRMTTEAAAMDHGLQ